MTPRVLIVGTGLIGTSIALALRHRGWPVLLDDAHAEHLRVAVDMGAGVPLEDDSTAVDLVVVAVPPSAAAAVAISHLRRHLNATVMDVSSTKAEVEAEVQSYGAEMSRRFVPTHPLSGREISGPAGSRADLFADRPWVLCPGADPESHQHVESLIRACGAFPVLLSAAEHDRTVALTSHVVQVMSSAMGAALERDPRSLDISGQGLRDVTRLADSDPQLWTSILRSNPGPVANVLSGILEDLTQIQASLQDLADRTGDSEHPSASGAHPESVITDFLARGQAGRSAIPGRHGSGPERLSQVRVQVADEPGALASVFVAAGALGINLLDVRIDHLWGRPSGLVELSVDPADAVALAQGLAAQGFDLRD